MSGLPHNEARSGQSRQREPCPACGCPGGQYDGHVCEDYAHNQARDMAARLAQTLGDDSRQDATGHIARELLASLAREQTERERAERAEAALRQIVAYSDDSLRGRGDYWSENFGRVKDIARAALSTRGPGKAEA